jgi:DNA-binding LytR/AlgR family response regulator
VVEDIRHCGFAQRLIAERQEAYWVVDLHRVAALESEGNYVRVMEIGSSSPAVIRASLQALGELLDPSTFLRISRSAIVNMANVERIERDADRHFVFVLRHGGRRFKVGRTFHAQVAQMVRMVARER